MGYKRNTHNRMESLRYQASARLGVWDSIPSGREDFLKALARILQDSSHGVLEADQIESAPTNNPLLASVNAICDKIIARGNPTLVDFEFERALLNGPCQRFFHFDERTEEDPVVGFRMSAFKIPDATTDQLLKAAQDLLCLPFRSQPEGETATGCTLLPEPQRFDSEEEKLFFDQFPTAFGSRFCTQLHPQRLIRDLVTDDESVDDYSRVDFVLQAGSLRWVFEVDGSQHNQPGQQALDQARDGLLEKHGWKVHRIPATNVRQGFATWFEQWKTNLSPEEYRIFDAFRYDSVQTAIGESEIHASAFYSILVPLAMHRCLRGLLLLYSHEILDPAHQQRILIIEEDLPVVVEAFRVLRDIWKRIHALAPDTPPAPGLELYVIDRGADLQLRKSEATHHIDAPSGSYDMILSHSFLLDAGYSGGIERSLFPDQPKNFVRLRHAIGFPPVPSLQRCEPLRYDLADVERSVASQNGVEPEPMPQEKHDALIFFLQHVLRKRNFRDGQLLVVARLLQGKDSIALLPTSAGKSLTYQLSGLLLPGMTVIIVPLVSLMNDQVANLEDAGIDLVDSVSSQLDPKYKEAVLRNMKAGRLAFTFISPERLQSQEFRNDLKTVVSRFPISLAVIDEAHCISEWGHDFRPSYLHMPHNLQRYCSGSDDRKPTLVGLTGTASFAVLNDIQTEMQVTDEDAIILSRSFDREELHFEVRKVPTREKPDELKKLKPQIPSILDSNPQQFYDLRGDRTNSGLVFCPHVNGPLGVKSVASKLGNENFFAGKKPKLFDGNWNNYKSEMQRAFKENRIQELVATKAFGMGIDKPNIRYTIHYTMPQSVEAFYQEAGRAGRDDQDAHCSILYSDDSWDSALEILNETNHRAACNRLEAINKNNCGDLLVQLWLMFLSYRGRSHDKYCAFDIWNKKLAPKITGMKTGAAKRIEVSFQEKTDPERAIFRLMLLGVVQDYTKDWQLKCFGIQVQLISPASVKEHLRRYLMQHKGQDFADDAVSNISEDTIENALRVAIDVLIDFIYDEIVAKRKQALRTMGELCRNFTSDHDFREAILAYLQESEFSKELKGWVTSSFDKIGLDKIHGLLGRDAPLDEAAKRRLIGTARRMLDEDPQNVALRYLSTCARVQSETESDSSVIQEAKTLVVQVDGFREKIHEPDGILFSVLHYLADHRPRLLNDVGDTIFRRAGTAALARLILRSELANTKILYEHSVILIAVSATLTLTDNVALRYLSTCARVQSEVESDDNVRDEATTLAIQLDRRRKEVDEPDGILLSVLHEFAGYRPRLLNDVGDTIFRRAGTAALARLILRSDFAKYEVLYEHSVKLIVASALRNLTESTFHTNTTHKRS